MGHKFAEIAFTSKVRALQSEDGSRAAYAAMEQGLDSNQRMSRREIEFITARDSFYMASVSETGWPYIQHRGGAAGFVKLIDEQTIGFADYSGNRQFISIGNFQSDNRVALFFMDYPNRQRLKMLGRVKLVGRQDPMLERLEDEDGAAQVHRGIVIRIEAFDWNCPQFITPRYTEAQIAEVFRSSDIERSQPDHGSQKDPAPAEHAPVTEDVFGEGALSLTVSGIRQLTPGVRAYELRSPEGQDLPEVEPGSHIRLPVRLANGDLVERRYSIAASSGHRDSYEIAVLRIPGGGGGSLAIHDTYQLGTVINTSLPENHFPLHQDGRPAMLIAGGIGITAIKPMAEALAARGSDFTLHYAARSYTDMAYRHSLLEKFTGHVHLYSSQARQRLALPEILQHLADDTVIYVCGPARMLSAVRNECRKLGINRQRVRLESFT